MKVDFRPSLEGDSRNGLIGGQCRRRKLTIVIKATIAVDHHVHPFLDNLVNSLFIQAWNKFCSMGILNAMIRPENLLQAIQFDDITNVFIRMLTGERFMICRVPILSILRSI